ncbi:hypothetical protein FIU97_11175 [Roseivivax sp. THAF40]|uniref:hypothetical protein n=1 Tax=unclassified Roseivivax TaxID=2639302 RepID=UPI0012695AB7|nr:MULTISPECIES: hypothetical protein [unclassified Roseivivax]QFS83391.1 hypothetical protein FIV09_11190 [Roseivivax sp. THAF197b]QFT47135.1 hypothetical protein FIU97_11175 [Roseivivax sp. THAF40]
MTRNNVYGVVLWANAQKGTAVIWCEDQGDLAFVTPDTDTTHLGAEIDAGDLVMCSVEDADDLYRRAGNLRRVQQGSHKPLPRMLVRGDISAANNIFPIRSTPDEDSEQRESCVA